MVAREKRKERERERKVGVSGRKSEANKVKMSVCRLNSLTLTHFLETRKYFVTMTVLSLHLTFEMRWNFMKLKVRERDRDRQKSDSLFFFTFLLLLKLLCLQMCKLCSFHCIAHFHFTQTYFFFARLVTLACRPFHLSHHRVPLSHVLALFNVICISLHLMHSISPHRLPLPNYSRLPLELQMYSTTGVNC